MEEYLDFIDEKTGHFTGTRKAYEIIEILIDAEVNKHKFEYLLQHPEAKHKNEIKEVLEVVNNAIVAANKRLYELDKKDIVGGIDMCRSILNVEATILETKIEDRVIAKIEDTLSELE